MSRPRILFAASLIVCVTCLATGFGIAGQWIGAIIVFVSGVAWFFVEKYPASGLALICLLVSICLAVIGCLVGSPPVLMIFGSGFALAAWDLLNLDHEMGSNPPGEQTRRYENRHLQSLALAIGSGLAVAVLGNGIRLQIPFVLLVICIGLAIFSLDRIWDNIKKMSR